MAAKGFTRGPPDIGLVRAALRRECEVRALVLIEGTPTGAGTPIKGSATLWTQA
jgi:hypothetical protein